MENLSVTPSDERFLRLAIASAHQARQSGNNPFGAVLVRNGVVLHQVYDRSIELCDPTFHAELSLISEYCRTYGHYTLEGYTLYTSTEPCLMCMGAIRWARISRTIYSVSQKMLIQLSKGYSNFATVNLDGKHVEIIGPILPEEGLAVFDGWFTDNLGGDFTKAL